MSEVVPMARSRRSYDDALVEQMTEKAIAAANKRFRAVVGPIGKETGPSSLGWGRQVTRDLIGLLVSAKINTLNFLCRVLRHERHD